MNSRARRAKGASTGISLRVSRPRARNSVRSMPRAALRAAVDSTSEGSASGMGRASSTTVRPGSRSCSALIAAVSASVAGRLEGHGFQIGRHLLGVERLEGLRIGGQRPGGHLGLRLGAGQRHRGPLEQERVLGGSEARRSPAARPPGTRCPAGALPARRGRGPQLALEPVGAPGRAAAACGRPGTPTASRRCRGRRPGAPASTAAAPSPESGASQATKSGLPGSRPPEALRSAGDVRRAGRGQGRGSSGLRLRGSGRRGIETKAGARPARKVGGSQGERETAAGQWR